MKTLLSFSSLICLMILGACQGPELAASGGGAKDGEEVAPREKATPATAQTSAAFTPRSDQRQVQPAIPAAKAAFYETLQLIESKYVDAEISEEKLWSGAIQGMLQQLLQSKKGPVNTLLDPLTLKTMREGLKGSFSGVGVVIEIIEGVVLIREVLEDGPAGRAGIQAGDRMLSVDDKSVRGMTMAQIVELIRGPYGSTVHLYLQREAREWNQPVVRGRIEVKPVNGAMLAPSTGYLRVASLKETTVRELDALLDQLRGEGAKALVLDLRGCPGGLLNVAEEVADRFLPVGAPIVSVRYRDGRAEQKKAQAAHPTDDFPLAIVVNSETASGAEIIASALIERGQAILVGEPTTGKGTVEEIFALKNGWALKLSVAQFFNPQGKPIQDQGLKPDFFVSGTTKIGKQLVFRTQQNLAPEQDPQLSTALSGLKLIVSSISKGS